MCDHIGLWSQQCDGHVFLEIKINKMKKFNIVFLFCFLIVLLTKVALSQPAQSRNLKDIRRIEDDEISDI